jgi:hypothetical protein
MPSIKLWLDDCRQAPEGWHWVRTAEEALAWLLTDTVSEASLDHDLGYVGRLTGYDVAVWLERHPEHYPWDGVVVHSMNPVGAEKMRVALANAEQQAKENK